MDFNKVKDEDLLDEYISRIAQIEMMLDEFKDRCEKICRKESFNNISSLIEQIRDEL